MNLYVFVLLMALLGFGESTKKKGVCLFMKDYHCNDTQALHDVTWWYDWGPWHVAATTSGCPLRGEFVPMIWGHPDTHINIPWSSKYLLGFNEPNIDSQSNMTPQKAASLWPQVEAAARAQGRALVSPVLARCLHGINSHCVKQPNQWLDEFFRACHNCTVDYIGVHTYTCNVENDMRYLETVHKHFNKQLWLTEFACPNSGSLHHIESYMRGIVPRLEKAPFVFRYAWYMARIPVGDNWIHKENALLEPHSSQLTALGQLYMSLH